MKNSKMLVSLMVMVIVIGGLVDCGTKDTAITAVKPTTQTATPAKSVETPKVVVNPQKAYIDNLIKEEDNLGKDAAPGTEVTVPDSWSKTHPTQFLGSALTSSNDASFDGIKGCSSFSQESMDYTATGLVYVVDFIAADRTTVIEKHKIAIDLQADKTWKLVSDTKL